MIVEPRVLDSRDDLGDIERVYVGRPTKWGNPFQIGPDGSRARVMKLFRGWVATRPDLQEAAKVELRGKNLACWCRPNQDCHAKVWLEIANS